MTNTDKLLLICIIGMCIGFSVAIYDAYKRGYEKGHRVGWHKGRSLSRQEFWQE
jgi:hypothetical protein